MNLQLFTKWYAKYLVFAAMCLFLLIVPILRGPWIGTEPFYYSMIASDFSFYDPLSYGGRILSDSILNALILVPAPNIFLNLLPFILGVISFFLLGKIFSHFFADQRLQNLALFITSLSPAFIYTFSFYNSLTLATFLSILGFYFYTNKNLKYFIVPIVVLLPFSNIAVAVCFFVLLFLFTFLIKKDRKIFFFNLFLLSFIAIFVYASVLIAFMGFPTNYSPGIEGSFQFLSKIMFDLGSPFGLGVFIVLLALVGAVGSWEKKYSSPFFFISIVSFLIISFFLAESLIFLSLFISVLAAFGLIKIFELRWENYQYKSFITMIIFLGLIFSSISQVTHLINSEPSKETIEAMNYLSTLEPNVVLSDAENGVWINYAGHKSVIDEDYFFAPNAEERYNDLQKLYASRDLANTTEILEKYDVGYIWIDEEMKEENWDYDTEGLLFVLQYTNDYYTMYNKDGIQIWRVNRNA
jgi:hypothetical protein